MSDGNAGTAANKSYYDVEKNAGLVLKLFNAYYREHTHSGKLYDDFPDFFLVKPEVLAGKDIATRGSEKLLLEDCIQRAKARNGYIGVSRHRNPKLGYYWLELSAMPFMMGDAVSKDNKGEFFYILTKFIEYTKQHPKMYGDLTAEIDSDKDTALMLDGIGKMASRLNTALKTYPEKMLVSYNPNWPVAEVQKLLHSLKENDQDWCQVFFEYLIYVMGKKSKT
ncbi:MAG: hypothetical protein A2V79_12315 [Betaproteobacteria bacterium RBG_16_56_24]|nr:MAG: hypothetical protein A2V79_12315 [Betaproteobacteria bacterium RBG_16_56_24]